MAGGRVARFRDDRAVRQPRSRRLSHRPASGRAVRPPRPFRRPGATHGARRRRFEGGPDRPDQDGRGPSPSSPVGRGALHPARATRRPQAERPRTRLPDSRRSGVAQGQLHGEDLPTGRAPCRTRAASLPRPSPYLRSLDGRRRRASKAPPGAAGHTWINVTLNTYGHLFPDAFNDVGEALDRLVRSSDETGVARR